MLDRSNAFTNITISVFLISILIAGTITAIFFVFSQLPSLSFITEVHALLGYGIDMDKKYKSQYLPYKNNNIKCNNINLNINGSNFNAIPKSINSLIFKSQFNKLQKVSDIKSTDTNSSNNGFDNCKKRFEPDDKKDFVFKPVNNSQYERLSSIDNNMYMKGGNNTFNTSNIFFSASHDNGTTFNTPINLSNNTNPFYSPFYSQFSSEKNNVYAVWQSYTDKNYNSFELYFTASHDNGTTFSTPIKVSNSKHLLSLPRISSEGNNVYVVWLDINSNTTNGLSIFYKTSHDNGTTFSTPKILSNNTIFPFVPQIWSQENNVYVEWEDGPLDNSDIFFSASHDNGTTFSTPINLSNNTGFSQFADVSSKGESIYMTWEDDTLGNYEVYFTASHDNGTTFSTPINLSNSTDFSGFQQISSKGSDVYVVWTNDFTYNSTIFFTASHNNGQNFSTPKNINNSTGYSYPRISSEQDDVYVVWPDYPPGNYEVYFTASHDNGTTFSTPINLSNNEKESTYPKISSEENNLYVVWRDHSSIDNGMELYFTASHDNGTTFSTPINLSNSTRSADPSQISSKGDNVYVIWHGVY